MGISLNIDGKSMSTFHSLSFVADSIATMDKLSLSVTALLVSGEAQFSNIVCVPSGYRVCLDVFSIPFSYSI